MHPYLPSKPNVIIPPSCEIFLSYSFSMSGCCTGVTLLVCWTVILSSSLNPITIFLAPPNGLITNLEALYSLGISDCFSVSTYCTFAISCFVPIEYIFIICDSSIFVLESICRGTTDGDTGVNCTFITSSACNYTAEVISGSTNWRGSSGSGQNFPPGDSEGYISGMVKYWTL